MSDEQSTVAPRKTGLVVAVVAGVVLAVAGIAVWAVVTQPQPVAVTDAGVALAPQVPDAGPAPEPAMDAAAAGALLTSGTDALSSSPELKDWFGQPGFLGRIVAAVASVSEGLSPRGTLSFLAPPGQFMVEEPKKKRKKTRTFVSPKNDERYDHVTQVIGTIDTAALGRLYRAMHSYLQNAYQEISPPGARFDDAVGKAIAHLAAVPITDGPRELVPMHEGTGYAWADPKLEALSPAQKHLLRMGPKNARVVLKQLEAFRAAAGL